MSLGGRKLPPDIFHYHKSVAEEIEVLKNRVSYLIPHNLTRGEWKEAILRAVLRRHLPETFRVGRGFIVTRDLSSTQIDVLILKNNKPTLFRDGDLFITSPDAPGAIVEVKSRIQGGKKWKEVVEGIAENVSICNNTSGYKIWAGIFAYDGEKSQIEHALDALCDVYKSNIVINCVTIGKDYFIRYFRANEIEEGEENWNSKPRFKAYKLTGLSSSYFVGNLIDAMCDIDNPTTGNTWFAYSNGKQAEGELIEMRFVDEC